MTVSIEEYAAFSAAVYNDQRGGGTSILPSERQNILSIPEGWVQLSPISGFPAQASYDRNLMSFTAGAYVNSSTGEIVIAYKAP